jgi:hypothetical protein
VWVIAGSELIVAFALSAASSVVRLVPGRLVYDSIRLRRFWVSSRSSAT